MTCRDVRFVDVGEAVEDSYVQATRVAPCPVCQRHDDAKADRLRELAGLPVPDGGRWRFEDYRAVNPAAKAARGLVQAWVQDEQHPWLFLHSRGTGTGKTHLACAAADALITAGHAVVFCSVPQLMTDLGAAIGEDRERREAGIHDLYGSRYQQMRQRLLGVPVLILDELGRHRATEFAEETLYELVSQRYASRTRLIVTTNVGAGEIDARIRSRLRDVALCTSVEMEWSDYRTRERS